MKKIHPLKSTASTLLTYTIIFALLMAGIFALFWIQGRSFVNSSDAYDQGYFWTAEMGHYLKSLFSGEGYPLWSWDRGTGLDTKLPIDPFMVIASLFPAGKIELGYTIAIILRLYFAGFAFILFAREVGMGGTASVKLSRAAASSNAAFSANQTEATGESIPTEAAAVSTPTKAATASQNSTKTASSALSFADPAASGNFKALIGAICYITSSFTINVALVQGQFIDMFILFPLLVMAVDRIYKGKSPLMFMLVVGITVGINYYLAFMAAIGIVIYILLRYFHYYGYGKESSLHEYGRDNSRILEQGKDNSRLLGYDKDNNRLHEHDENNSIALERGSKHFRDRRNSGSGEICGVSGASRSSESAINSGSGKTAAKPQSAGNNFSYIEYIGYIGRFILYGIAGIMLSAVFVYVTIVTLSGASTGTRPEIEAFYSMKHYYQSALRLVSAGYTFGYKYIGIPILALLVLPVISCRANAKHKTASGSFAASADQKNTESGMALESQSLAKKKPAEIMRQAVGSTHAIMAVIMSLMALSPFFGSMFNGFGYVSNRWYFMLIFFLVWCAAEHMDLDRLAEKRNVIIMLVWWCILAFTTIGFAYLDISGDLSKRQAVFVGGSLAAGLVMVIFIAAAGRKALQPPQTAKTAQPSQIGQPAPSSQPGQDSQPPQLAQPPQTRHAVLPLRTRQAVLTLMLIVTITVLWNCSFYGHIEEKFFRYGEIDRQLQKSTQRAGSLIDDDGFYRIDQTDWINSHLKADQPVNENLWWQNNTIYLYDSKLPARLSEFNRLLGNNMGYSKRVYVQSNGNRMGLDFLYGVKYYLGDDEENGRLGADAFAGYAFDYWKNLDGVNVFKSRYDSSLGFVYDKWITESEFGKLSRLEREQSLLQALVVPDEEVTEMDETMEVKASDIETDIEDVPFEIISADGVKVKDSSESAAESEESEAAAKGSSDTESDNSGLKNGVFVAKKDNASITLQVDGIKDSQLVVSFDNLRRVSKSGENRGNFILKCQSDKLQAEANNKKNNQTIAGIVDYDLNMGYYDSYSGKLTIKFSKKGTYEFDRLYVSAMSTANFDKFAAERSKAVYEVAEQKSDRVTGTLDTAGDGYLFLSIPVNANWNVYIDGGQVAEIHNANIAFFATPVTAGKHTVELRYDHRNRNIALAITLAGLVMTILLTLAYRRKNNMM